MAGWFKFYREITKKPIWKNSTPEQKTILVTLMCMVNHSPEEWEWNGQKFSCEPGQKVTSLEKIVDECGKGISTQNVRTALVRFKKLGFLTDESTKTGRLITIVNWEKYQDIDNQPNKVNNKDLTKRSQRPNKDLTPNKNDKNNKNDKEDIYKGKPVEVVEALKAFVDMRSEIKKPLTGRGLKTAVTRLDKLSNGDMEKAVKIIDQATEKCWLTFYELKEESTKIDAEAVKKAKAEKIAEEERAEQEIWYQQKMKEYGVTTKKEVDNIFDKTFVPPTIEFIKEI